MPPLLMQPIVENAIKFGLYNTTDSINITIDVHVRSGILEIRIVNPFDPDTPPQQGTGFGLASIRRRLYLLYARNDLLETSAGRSEEHTSELQSLMRISYAVFCLKQKI